MSMYDVGGTGYQVKRYYLGCLHHKRSLGCHHYNGAAPVVALGPVAAGASQCQRAKWLPRGFAALAAVY